MLICIGVMDVLLKLGGVIDEVVGNVDVFVIVW